MARLRDCLRSAFFMEYGMVVILIAICIFLAIWTLEPGPAVPGAAGASQFLETTAATKRSVGGTALVILPSREQLKARRADPPLGPDGEPLGLLDVERVRAEVGPGKLFAEAVEYRPRRVEMTAALRAALLAHPDARLVAYTDQTHDRIPGILATVTAATNRTVEVAGPPRGTVSVFLRKRNLINIARQISVFAIIAVGMTMVILTGGIDLSVGSLVALYGVCAALMINRPEGIPWWSWGIVGLALGAGGFSTFSSRIGWKPLSGGVAGGGIGLGLGGVVGLLCLGHVVGVEINVPATSALLAKSQDSGSDPSRGEVLVLFGADCDENHQTVEALAGSHGGKVEGLAVDMRSIRKLGQRAVIRDRVREAVKSRPGLSAVVTLDPLVYTLVQEIDVPDSVGVMQAPRRAWGLLSFAILFTVVVGAATGVFSGTVINVFRIPPFIATLALMQIGRGLAYSISQGRAIPVAYGEFAEMIGRGFLFEGWLGELLPIPVAMMLVCYLLAYVVLHHSKFGRYLYAVGGNEGATFLSGVPVGWVRFGAYVVTGVTAALGGVIVASKLGSGDPNSGQLFELYVIAACVVGGASLQGGEGKVFGTLVGALLLGVLNNGLTLLNVDSYIQMVVVGTVILLAVLLDQAKKRLH